MIPLEQNIGQNNWGHQRRIMERLLPLILQEIYVTGYTSGLENYKGLDGNTSLGSTDIFLVKYDSSGTKKWTKQFGTSSSDEGTGVTTDSSGNIYVTGKTSGNLDANTSSGGEDIFLVKYNSDGVKQ